MVKEQLTAEMIDAGAELTAKLDENGLPLTTALWLFASPEVGIKGREIYEKIDHAINQLGDKASAVPLSVVSLLDANTDLVRRLEVTLHTGPRVNRIRFSKNVADGHFIDDALIYRAA
jgi:hypothetical protein